MKIQHYIYLVFLIFLALPCPAQGQEPDSTGELMVRIAALEIDTAYLGEYLAILKEEAEASVRLEPGVICIYPMYQKENPAEIRLLEIYADTAAYEAHLKMPHFKEYKAKTLKMVKSLELIEMQSLDKETMPLIFKKLK